MAKIYISVIIPVYNESKRIKNLNKVINYFEKINKNCEIIVVNDGSFDDTLDLTKKIFSKKHSRKISKKTISYKNNKGKGYAIKRGMASAKGKFRLFMDIDLSTPLSTTSKFESFFNTYHVIIGSRKMKGSKVTQKQTFVREKMGKTFTSLSRFILQVKVSDFTCGYKCFSADSAKKIFKKQKIERWGFDSEILFLATHMDYKIKEVPVVWRNHPNTKVKFPRDLINSLIELIKIRNNHFRNKYNLKD